MMYLLLIVGFVFLIKGADLFVEGAGSLAHSLKIPSIIIGLTVIAMGTSAPETAVSISSSLQGANEIAVGNVVGSNLFNLLVVVGVCSILHPIKITKEITKRDFGGILLVVANPVDILTQVAIKLSGLPEERVIGSGTVLDSARLRSKLGQHLSVDSRSVHAFIVGEHGDSEVVAWSSANVSGVPLSDMCEMRGHYNHKENTEEIAAAVKNSAYEIINKKHATYYGIAMSVKRICEVIMRDEKSILPVSHMIHGVYEIDDVVLSMPVIVGADGIESDIPINLSGEEALKLKESADALKNIIDTLEL